MALLIYYAMVTYVTVFNKCVNLVVKPAKSMILYYMSKTLPKYYDIQQQQILTYIFYLNYTYQIGLLKNWDRAV